MLKWIAALTLFGAVNVAVASPWSGKLALGAIATDGNSEASTLNSEVVLGYQQGIWKSQFTGQAIHARSEVADDTGASEAKTTTERYLIKLRNSWDFTEFNYVFVEADFEKDLFGGIRERTSQTAGYGRRLIKTDSQTLDLELGAGARQTLAQDDQAARESDAIGRLAMKYGWKITDTSRLGQALSIESGAENTYTESVTELKLSVVGGVFATLGFTVKHNSDVPAQTENTDTVSSVSLSYEF